MPDCSILLLLGQPSLKRPFLRETSIKHQKSILLENSKLPAFSLQCFKWTLSENIFGNSRPHRMKFNLFNCKAFRKKKHVAQGGAILDQVISESCSPNNKVLLYKLANYKLGLSRLRNNPSPIEVFLQTRDYENLIKSSPILHTPGGDLIDAFNIGGQHAVEELIRDQFGVFMYKGGKGQIINRAEYLRWKYMENAEVS